MSVIMYCQECNKETPNEALFCMECGARVNKECPRCAEIIKLKARMCLHCKYELTENDIQLVEKEERQRWEKQEEAQRQMEALQREEGALHLREEYSSFHPPALIAQWGDPVRKCANCGTLHPRYLQIEDLGNVECRWCRKRCRFDGCPNPYRLNDFSNDEIRVAFNNGVPIRSRPNSAAPVPELEPEPPPEPERQTSVPVPVPVPVPAATTPADVVNTRIPKWFMPFIWYGCLAGLPIPLIGWAWIILSIWTAIKLGWPRWLYGIGIFFLVGWAVRISILGVMDIALPGFP